MFCNHKWELISETITESKFEHAISILRPNVEGKFTVPAQMSCAERKHIQIVTCAECGKLKRFVESI